MQVLSMLRFTFFTANNYIQYTSTVSLCNHDVCRNNKHKISLVVKITGEKLHANK